MKAIDPQSVHPPIGGAYTHAIELTGSEKLLFVSGQLGVTREGQTLEDVDAQFDQAWANVSNILDQAGMDISSIVKVTCFLAGLDYREPYLASCERALGSHRPAMTAAIVESLWSEEWFFEFDVIAAAA
ncbi:RidA family protein [uncultured Erythrobacter sp.]|uniref:RidA family protein n=1 Tax=uncultured Erythrobacter sp. TaxID=263913 RepID=UPI002637F4E1|nr:RidA family protein [uncultured Erythrobacter sp.]